MSAEPTAELQRLLVRLAEMGGTDLYLTVGAPPMATVGSEFVALEREPLTSQAMAALAAAVLTGERSARFAERPDLDVAHVVPGRGRFRINLYRQRGELAMVARRVEPRIRSADELGLPEVVKRMALLRHGVVFVVGATGSGKSTTLAAMIDHRNSTTTGHIVTIEDPIEFIHPHKRSVVSQREVGADTASFHDAMRSALRQAPDMVLIGEVRDAETAEAALHMAETGHLVLATLHATNAAQTLERLVNLFPEERRPQILLLLSLELGGIIAQRLVPAADRKGRVAAVEVLVPTPRVRDLVRRGDIEGVKEAMREALGADGMQTFEEALAALVGQGRIRVEDALAFADSANDLRLRLRREQALRAEREQQQRPDVPAAPPGTTRRPAVPPQRRPGEEGGGLRIL
ncbi:MAG: twitching motility protein PilU [Planctomycetota bacterium]|nr:MAG: twitching motility protein PilU [Planctomycetota bacterium]